MALAPQRYTDDIDPTVEGTREEIKSVRFAISDPDTGESTLFSIDLGEKNRKAFDSGVKRFREKASEVTADVVILPREAYDKMEAQIRDLTEQVKSRRRIAPRASDSGNGVVSNGDEKAFNEAVRAYAKREGTELAAHGRLPQEWKDKYAAYLASLPTGSQPTGDPNGKPADTASKPADTAEKTAAK